MLLVVVQTARSQDRTAGPDPQLAAILEAERDGRLADADKLLSAALQDAERDEPNSRRVSLLLNHLASLRQRQGRLPDAIDAAKQQLALDEKIFGAESPNVAGDFSNLGMFCIGAGEDAAAEQAYKSGLDIARQNPGPRSQVLLMLLNNLSAFYDEHQRTADAQSLIEEGLAVCDKEQPGPTPASCAGFRARLAINIRHEGDANAAEGIISDAVAGDPDSGRQWYAKVTDLNTLARQYEEDSSFDLAESAYREAISLIEKNSKLAPTALTVNEYGLLGRVIWKQGRDQEAEELYKRALEMQEQAASPKRPDLALYPPFAIIDLANLYRDQGRPGEIEPVLGQWLALQERILGPRHIALAQTLIELAQIHEEEKEYSKAEPLLERALEIQQENLGPENTQLIPTLDQCARLLDKTGQAEKAEAMRKRAAALRKEFAPSRK